MIDHLNWIAAGVFICFLPACHDLGFVAAHWKRGDLNDLNEWGLGGRRFGAWITWFLIGGDIYTAYTVIAVPSVVYAIGAYGFFAVPYTIIIYPLIYADLPPPVGRGAYARLYDRHRLCAGPLRQQLARACGCLHRHIRDHALYRVATRRHGKGHRRSRFPRRGLWPICRSPSPSSSSRSTPIAAACARRP